MLTPGTLLTVDDDNNGKLDRITATFSEILTSQGTGTAFTLANVPSGSTLGLVDVTGGTNAALVLNVGPGPADTAVGSFTIALSNATSGGIGDAAGTRASFPATAPLDRAEPIVTSILMRDVNVNGKVDQLDIAFSEILGPYTIKTRSPFTLTNVPSNGSPGIETFVGNMAILAVNEGNGAADTSVGNFTVDLKTNIRGVQDPAANLSFFAGRSPIDGAAAVPVSLTSTNGTIDGLVQPGDNISVTFSEGLDPATVIRNTDVTLTAPVGGGNNTLSIGGITNGALSLGTTGYVTAPGTSASFAASTVALSNLNRTITVTVAGACTGTGCGALGAPAVAGTFTYQPSPALKGVAGISAVGSVAVTTRIF